MRNFSKDSSKKFSRKNIIKLSIDSIMTATDIFLKIILRGLNLKNNQENPQLTEVLKVAARHLLQQVILIQETCKL